MQEETITISKKEYDKLFEDQKLLRALKAVGVDNWDGYGFALEAVYGNDEDQD